MSDHSISRDSRDEAERLRREAETQLKILVDEGAFQSDFYSYRYFASEGFLPGYNSPRLPLPAYLPGRYRQKGIDDFVSRARERASPDRSSPRPGGPRRPVSA